ncbi:MAG TPA: helix-hairpin-helix domain-containing protein [Chryseolinea sp.]|nr:helix-hairpin-helix domain-containing protein [Chryseolinea sp.]
MLPLKHWIKVFFGFSRSQVNGFIILLPLTTLFLFSEPVWHWWVSRQTIDFTADRAKLDSLVALWSVENDKNSNSENNVPKRNEFFAFNPNNASNSDFLALGFSVKLASRIVNYREKGGKFRIKSDLLKIYGFDSAFYHQVQPYITLPEHAEKIKVKEKFQLKKTVAPKKEPEKFNLNLADTAQLKKIYGIGDKLSLRIVKYRDVLGGFISMKQLNEVYGLDSAVVNRLARLSFVEDEFHPVRLNINTATEKQLSVHPYLGKAAKTIVAYRFQHGEFTTLEDIRNVGSLDATSVERIIPYLKLKDE